MKPLSWVTYLTVLFVVLFLSAGCESDSSPEPEPDQVNEALMAVEYLESNGDYLNTSAPSIVAASDVYLALQSSPGTQYLVDMRSAADFAAGHIAGAVNVPMSGLVGHFEGTSTSGYTRVVLVCYSGQTAGFATMALRMLGYSNTYSLKWGMSSWDSVFAAGKWLGNMSNGQATQFVTTAASKNAIGGLPVISTGKSVAAEIVRERIATVLTEGFTTATISNAALFGDLSSYYIVNYWSETDYNTGHIPGAVQYTPKASLRVGAELKTLPVDKPVVVYCYTGQTSAFVAMYLRVLGYDAKSLLYGANAMIYDTMPGTKFGANQIMGYPYVTGS